MFLTSIVNYQLSHRSDESKLVLSPLSFVGFGLLSKIPSTSPKSNASCAVTDNNRNNPQSALT